MSPVVVWRSRGRSSCTCSLPSSRHSWNTARHYFPQHCSRNNYLSSEILCYFWQTDVIVSYIKGQTDIVNYIKDRQTMSGYQETLLLVISRTDRHYCQLYQGTDRHYCQVISRDRQPLLLVTSCGKAHWSMILWLCLSEWCWNTAWHWEPVAVTQVHPFSGDQSVIWLTVWEESIRSPNRSIKLPSGQNT